MRRPREHVVASESATLLRRLLPSDWILRRVEEDYGVDFEVEVVDSEIVTGKRLWLQLKGTAACQKAGKRLPVYSYRPKGGTFERRLTREVASDAVVYRIDTKLLSYAQRCPFPLLLMVAILRESEVYWLPLRDHLELSLYRPDPGWQDRATATLYLPGWNRLTYESSRGFAGLRWYALEPARMYDFAKIHQWSEQLRIWDAITDGIAVGIDGFHLPARSDNPTMHLLTCLTHSEAMFSAVLQFRATLWCSSTEIGSCARQMLEEGVVASHRAIELLRKGPPYRPEELGSLIGVVSSARRSLASISLRFEEGRKLHILSDISAGEDSRFKWYLRQRM